MKNLFFCLSLIFSLQSWAQVPEYEIKGSLGTRPDDKKKNIEFSLQWSEENNRLTGTYKDNYFTKEVPIKGISGDQLGRIIVVNLPKESKGVKTLTFLGSDLQLEKGSTEVPLGVVLRNERGNPVTTSTHKVTIAALPKPAPAPTPIASASPSSTRTSADVVAAMTPAVAQRQEAGQCIDGFGSLAGYCGSYTGVLTEERDVLGKCNLLAFNNSRLVMDEDGEVSLALGVANAVVRPPVHRIGRIPADPDTTGIEVMSRSCGPLAGTEFEGENCKRLVLIGSFSTIGDSKHFTGTYEIIDANTEQSCLYGLSMNADLK